MKVIEKIQLALFSLLGAYIGSLFSVYLLNPSIPFSTIFGYVFGGIIFIIILAILLDQLL